MRRLFKRTPQTCPPLSPIVSERGAVQNRMTPTFVVGRLESVTNSVVLNSVTINGRFSSLFTMLNLMSIDLGLRKSGLRICLLGFPGKLEH